MAKRRFRTLGRKYGDIVPRISEVYLIDVKGQIEHRKTKYFVCVSVAKDKYLIINSEHREIYDDLEVDSCDYPFFDGKSRFVGCSRLHHFSADKIIKAVGCLYREDMMNIRDKIRDSKVLDKHEKSIVLCQIEQWLLQD